VVVRTLKILNILPCINCDIWRLLLAHSRIERYLRSCVSCM